MPYNIFMLEWQDIDLIERTVIHFYKTLFGEQLLQLNLDSIDELTWFCKFVKISNHPNNNLIYTTS